MSLRTLELPPFTLAETRLLLSQPLKHARRPEARAAVGIFGSGFWGADGMDRIHAKAGGWPHLVQLLPATVVDLCNTQGLDRATPAVLDAALPKAVVSGDSVLAELLLYRSEEHPTAWKYLSAFRTQDTQPPPADDALRPDPQAASPCAGSGGRPLDPARAADAALAARANLAW